MFAFMKNSLKEDLVFPKYSVIRTTNAVEFNTLVRIEGMDGKYYLAKAFYRQQIPDANIDPTELVIATQKFVRECYLSINLSQVNSHSLEVTNAQGDSLFWLDECQYTERDRLRLRLGHAIDFTKYEGTKED